ncbi:MAG: FecR domain-containing protein [Bacteroidota bacterium]
MNHESIRTLLDDYVDGILSADDMQEVRLHLQSCSECSEEIAQLRSLLATASTLPRVIVPPRDLWSGISDRISLPHSNIIPLHPHGIPSLDNDDREAVSSSTRQRGAVRFVKATLRIAAAVVIAIGSFLLTLRSPGKSWEVARLQGKPLLGSEQMGAKGQLEPGEWLETDADSRAKVTVANIGHVELGPNSRLRLLNTQTTEHRLELARGQLHAQVWSPPRIFVVETPSATAIDLGCAYDLLVDPTGASTLIVLTGEVSLESLGRESYVPAGARCETRPGLVPGTPYANIASDEFRRALQQFDFGSNPDALDNVLNLAAGTDAISLWHLIFRVDEQSRGRVYDRLAEFIKPPEGVTKEGVLRLDKSMLEQWLDEFTSQLYSYRHFVSAK